MDKKKVKEDKLAALYIHLVITAGLDLIHLERLNLIIDQSRGNVILEFNTSDKQNLVWFSLTKTKQ